MKPIIVLAYPPNIEDIDRVFKVRDVKGVLYAWGERIYNPSGIAVDPYLMAHEAVHQERQLAVDRSNNEASIRLWWVRYIADKGFRFAEEVPAHKAEYAAYCARISDRNQRATYLHAVCLRLASSMYGHLCSPVHARAAILGLNWSTR